VPFSNNDGTETRYTITEDDGTAGTIYFACSMYPLNSWSHCSVGMKVRVHIVGEDEEPAPPSPDLPAPGSPPADVEIMNNGAFGYGASWTSITGLPYEDHYATVGDTLVFYHSTSHNAVKMLDEESFDNCSPSGSVVVPFSNNDGTETRYTITEDDGTAGTIYFACSMYPLNAWSHCSVGMKVRVHIVGEDEVPAPPAPGCVATFMDLDCAWFGEDPGRCSMVYNSESACPTQCRTTMTLACAWFEEDPTRCSLVPASKTQCAYVCSDDCN